MRQYKILFLPNHKVKWHRLKPGAAICDVPEVQEAVQLMAERPSIEGITVRIPSGFVNIVLCTTPWLETNCFTFAQRGRAA